MPRVPGQRLPPRAPPRRLGLEEGPVARRVHVREVEDGANPSSRTEMSTTSSIEPRSRTRPMTSTPKGTARCLAASRSLSVSSCSTTASIASSRGRPRKPGWKTTSSRRSPRDPRARSRAPTAEVNLRPLASRWPMKPKSGGVHGERDVVLARELAEALGERIVHPEAALEVDLARRIAPLEQELDRALRRLARRAAGRPHADTRRHQAIVVAHDVIAFRREGDAAPGGLCGRLRRQAHDRRRGRRPGPSRRRSGSGC